MKVYELIDLLQTFPSYLDVWVSDAGYAEGGMPLKSVEKISAWDAGLDGDEVNDEWMEDEDADDPYIMHKEGYENYHSDDCVWSKSIILIRSTFD